MDAGVHMVTWVVSLAVAQEPVEPTPVAPAEVPEPAELTPVGPAEAPKLADAHAGSSFGFGFAHLGGTDAESAQRTGLHIELQSRATITRHVQFNLAFGTGLTRFDRTIAAIEWGTGVGGSITTAFGDVYDWSNRGPRELRELRYMGAFFAYFGLGISYIAVPVTYVLSPLASMGHAFAGPSLSWHSAQNVDVYIEGGVGGMYYGDPTNGGPAIGYGPLLGFGTHLAGKSVGVRAIILPPGAQLGSEGASGTVLTTSVFVGL
jgi:hypothetical protein